MSCLDEMIHSDSMRARYRRRLQVIAESHPTASAQGKIECCRSGVCCWRRPCQLDHDDPQRIAAFLGLTPESLFAQYLVVDTLGKGLALVPRRKQQKGGHYLSTEETYQIETPCVFLGDGNACQIHEVKPRGGRHYKCWDPNTHTDDPPGSEWREGELMALGWDGRQDTDD